MSTVAEQPERGNLTPGQWTIAALAEIHERVEQIGRDLGAVEIPTDRTDQETLRIFGAIDQAAKRLEAISKKAKERRDGMNEKVLDALERMGVKNAPLQGGPTVFQERTLWAGTADEIDDVDEAYRAACEGLVAAGLEEYVQTRFNVQSLSGYFRERERELEAEARERDGLPADAPVVIDLEELIPEELRGLVKVTESVKAKARKS